MFGFGGIGLPELLIILLILIALLIFGPKRLIQLGQGLGKGLGELKDGLERGDLAQEDGDENEEEG